MLHCTTLFCLLSQERRWERRPGGTRTPGAREERETRRGHGWSTAAQTGWPMQRHATPATRCLKTDLAVVAVASTDASSTRAVCRRTLLGSRSQLAGVPGSSFGTVAGRPSRGAHKPSPCSRGVTHHRDDWRRKLDTAPVGKLYDAPMPTLDEQGLKPLQGAHV